MKKIQSLFVRDYAGNRQVINEVVAGSEWVIAGEGVATRKHDGTSCMVKGGALYKRYDAKAGKTPPDGFIPAQDPDEKTGHWPGWLHVSDNPADKYHVEAFKNGLADGTYELVGPKIQGNPDGYEKHTLVLHGIEELTACPREYNALKEYLSVRNIEGIVWHHPDGRMVKIKAKDFGLKRS